mgnify:CR=1 FL=1
MTSAIKLMTIGYFVGLAIFVGIFAVALLNLFGLTWIEIPGRLIIAAGVLLFGSKAGLIWLNRREEVTHG